MQRKFIANLALLLFLNILIKPFWILGVDREVQIQVGSSEYGLYFALFNFSFVLNALLDLGITNFNNKNIAQHSHLLTKHFSNIVGLKLWLALGYTAVTMSAGFLLGYRGIELQWLFLLCINQFLISFIFYIRSNISGLHLFVTDSIISVLDRLIMIAICGILLWGNFLGGRFEISWFIYTQTAGYALTALIAFFVVMRQAGSFQLRWNKAFFYIILKKSIPFAILILLMMVYYKTDTIMLERLLEDGPTQSGIYAQAYRLLDSVNMIGFLFAGMLLPIFSRMIKKEEAINHILNLSLSLILSVAIVTSVGSYFYREPLMDLLYEQHVKESASAYGILMFSFVPISLVHILGTLLTAKGTMRQLNYIALAAVVVNITLNLLLIPVMKATGAAIAGVATHSFVATLQLFTIGKVFRFNVKYRLIATIAFFSACVVAINYLCSHSDFDWRTSFIIMVVASVICAFVTRMLPLRGFLQALKLG